MKKYLPADANSTVWIVTLSLMACLLLLLVLAGGIPSMPASAVEVLYIAAGIIALVLLTGWRAKPMRYEVRDDSVSVVRSFPFSPLVIQKPEIKEVRHVRLGSIRPTSVAVGWIFGYAGRFQSEELGPVVLLATNPANAVLVHADQKYVFTPANPKRFMNDVLGRK